MVELLLTLYHLNIKVHVGVILKENYVNKKTIKTLKEWIHSLKNCKLYINKLFFKLRKFVF